MKRPTKLEKLVAVYDQFLAAIDGTDDDFGQQFVDHWKATREEYASSSGADRPSELAAGLEEGLRDFLMMLAGKITTPDGMPASRALHAALAKSYPDFIVSQERQLGAILANGRIASERQFALVRSAIDVAEGEPQDRRRLVELYRLVDVYEARARRR